MKILVLTGESDIFNIITFLPLCLNLPLLSTKVLLSFARDSAGGHTKRRRDVVEFQCYRTGGKELLLRVEISYYLSHLTRPLSFYRIRPCVISGLPISKLINFAWLFSNKSTFFFDI